MSPPPSTVGWGYAGGGEGGAQQICPGFPAHALVDKQIPEMLKETVDGEFITTDDVADAVLFFAGARSNALAGQSMVVSHGWFMR
jgi:3-hydroxybutyrate dehydrogenase